MWEVEDVLSVTNSLFSIIEEYTVDRCSNKHCTSCILNDGDHVVGDLTRTAFRVPGSIQIVAQKQTVHGKAGFFRHFTCLNTNTKTEEGQ